MSKGGSNREIIFRGKKPKRAWRKTRCGTCKRIHSLHKCKGL